MKVLKISVIIPALNEASLIEETIKSIKGAFEIIVVDGGSTDGTARVAKKAGARVVEAKGGRGAQLARGEANASGEIILFLHADTRLPSGWAVAVRGALASSSVAAGAFTLTIDTPGLSYRLVELGVRVRSRVFSLPYGDQAIFTTRGLFKKASDGVAKMPLMEDVYLVRRLKKYGSVVTLPERVITSQRMWQRRGVALTTLRNLFLLTLFSLGVSPEKLYHLYYKR